MTESWGAPFGFGGGGWKAAKRDLDLLIAVLDPPALSLPLDKPRLEYVCRTGHSLIKAYPLAESDDTRGTALALWLATVVVDGPGNAVMERQPHYGFVPRHVVDVDQHTRRPIIGALIGGRINAECRCGRGAVHTRQIEGHLDENQLGRRVLTVDRHR